MRLYEIFKEGEKEICKAQEEAILVCYKTSWRERQLAWLNRGLQLEIMKKWRIYDIQKKGHTSQEGYKDFVRLCRKKIRKSKAQLELHLTTAVKDNKKWFF